MGSCKDTLKDSKKELETLEKDRDKSTSLLGRMRGRRRSDKDDNLGSLLQRSDVIVSRLIATKEGELRTEKGSEEYNQQALAKLKTMQFHLEEIVALVEDYLDGE